MLAAVRQESSGTASHLHLDPNDQLWIDLDVLGAGPD